MKSSCQPNVRKVWYKGRLIPWYYIHDFTYKKSFLLIKKLISNMVATKYERSEFSVQLPDLTEQENIREKADVTYALSVNGVSYEIFVPYVIYHTLVDTKAIHSFRFIKSNLLNGYSLINN